MTTSRRAFSRILGTGAFAVPLLWRYGRTIAAGPSPSGPRRLLIFWNPQGNCSGLPVNGVDAFWPTGTEKDFKLSRILAPLERHKKDLLLLKGFNDWATMARPLCSPIVSDGEHGFGTMCRLTNTCPTTASVGGAAPRQWGGGISIDQAISQTVGADTPRPSLELIGSANKNSNHRGFISYSGAGRPVIPQASPLGAYDSLFGGSTGLAGDPARVKALRAMRKSSLDHILSEIARVRSRLPASERAKMDGHFEAVRVLERDLDDRAPTVSCDRQRPPFPADPIPTFPTRHELHFRTIAAAFACDLTRVATFMAASGGGDTAPDLRAFMPDWQTNYHSTGHASGGNSDGGGNNAAVRDRALEVMIRVSTYYADQLAKFVDALKAIPEGAGTVFDNTVILWCSEMSHGNHGNSSVPYVVIGGGWHLRTGRFLDLPTYSKYDFSNKSGTPLVLMANAMGLPISSFGRADWCDGPDKLTAIRG